MSLCKSCANRGDNVKCYSCKYESTLKDNYVPVSNMKNLQTMDVRDLAKFIVDCYGETCCKHCKAENKRIDRTCSGDYCIGKSEEDIVVEWLLSAAKEEEYVKIKK